MLNKFKKLDLGFNYTTCFITVLLLKLLAIFYYDPTYVIKIFKPVSEALFSNTQDLSKITKQDYPFGIIITLIQIASFKIDFFISEFLNNKISFIKSHHIFTGLITLLFDYLIYKILVKVSNSKTFSLLYWILPLNIYINYILGTFDVIPLCLLLISYFFIQKLKPVKSAIFYSIAVNCKLSMIIPLPLILIYLYRNNRFKFLLKNFILYLAASFLIIFSLSYNFTGFTSIKQPFSYVNKLFALSVKFSEQQELFIIPIIYTCLMYYCWYLRKTNWNILNSIISVGFLVIALLSPSNITWFLWPLPFLIFNFSKLKSAANHSLLLIFTTVIMLHHIIDSFTPENLNSIIYLIPILLISCLTLLKNENNFSNFKNIIRKQYALILCILAFLTAIPYGKLNKYMTLEFIQYANKFTPSLIFAIGLVLILRLLRYSIYDNNFYKMTRKPILISIAGDSSSGKDTLSNALTNIIGNSSAVTICGDDYHLYDRYNTTWQKVTHLNPQANDLPRLNDDIEELINMRPINITHYNHETGRYELPDQVKPKDWIILNGLHSLYHENIRQNSNLKIFLDIDEDLRKYLKIKRDVEVRKHSIEKVIASINKRLKDAEKFIQPQKIFADMIVSLIPIKKLDDKFNINKHTALKIDIYNISQIDKLIKLFIGIGGLAVNKDIISPQKISLTIFGNISSCNINLIAEQLFGNLLEILGSKPEWKDDNHGILQIITLACLFNKL